MKCLPKATVRLKACAVLFPCIVILQAVAIGTDFWEATAQANNETEWEGHRGLFKDCRRSSTFGAGNSAYLCKSIEHPPSWLVSVRVMESVGIFGIGFLTILTLIFSVRTKIALLCRMLSILISISTGILIFTGMFTYAHNKSLNYRFHVSFYLCVASVGGIATCTFLLIRDLQYQQRHKTDRNRLAVNRNFLLMFGGRDSDTVSHSSGESTNSEREMTEIPDQQHAEPEPEVIELSEVHPHVPPPSYLSLPPPNYSLPPPSYDMLESEGLI